MSFAPQETDDSPRARARRVNLGLLAAGVGLHVVAVVRFLVVATRHWEAAPQSRAWIHARGWAGLFWSAISGDLGLYHAVAALFWTGAFLAALALAGIFSGGTERALDRLRRDRRPRRIGSRLDL